MLVHWMTDEDGLHYAAGLLGSRGTLHMQVDNLGESGWDWHVWERLGRGQQRYGLADSLPEAQARAEGVLSVLIQELGLAS